MDVDPVVSPERQFFVPLKRSNIDLCFYGDKSSGKTLAMTYYGFLEYLKGRTVYSNYTLNFPHKRVNSIDDILGIEDGCFLGDDFEAWVSSKFRSNKDKASILEATLNFGKRNVDPFIWSCKRPLEIDKTLRYTVDFFCKCNFLLKYTPGSFDDYVRMSGFLDAHVVQIDVFNAVSLVCDRVVVIDDLDLYCELYETREPVRKLLVNNGSEGKRLQNLGV